MAACRLVWIENQILYDGLRRYPFTFEGFSRRSHVRGRVYCFAHDFTRSGVECFGHGIALTQAVVMVGIVS